MQNYSYSCNLWGFDSESAIDYQIQEYQNAEISESPVHETETLGFN